MSILIKKADGEATPLINGEYLSAYYFSPVAPDKKHHLSEYLNSLVLK